MAAGAVVRVRIYERAPVRPGSADRSAGGLTAALVVVVQFNVWWPHRFVSCPRKRAPRGPIHARSPGPRFPHGSSPWAEGAQGDEEKKRKWEPSVWFAPLRQESIMTRMRPRNP
jgi:hypothetical protein